MAGNYPNMRVIHHWYFEFITDKLLNFSIYGDYVDN
jgi:hypothetical protein